MKKINLYFLIISFFVLMFSACSKDSKEIKSELLPIEPTDFKESPNDFLTVDFEYFYKELSSTGEWIEIDAKKLGLDLKPTASENSSIDLISDILGVKSAYAQTGEQMFNLFVWKPTNELASDMVKESKEYIPYNNGQWIFTDEGWYFKANTPQEELTSHYGRWTKDEELGWIWLPGKTYSPAWVDWRQNDAYVAWAPIPPNKYIENDAVKVEEIEEDRYTIVEKKYLIEPSVYKYRYQYVKNKNKIIIKEMIKTDGVMIKEKKVINKGPDLTDIEKKTGKKIEQVKVNKVRKKEEARVKDNSIYVFIPELKKSKEVNKEPLTKPEKLVSYKDAKRITKEDKEKLKTKDEIEKWEEKIKKEEKLEDKEIKKQEQQKKKEETKKDDKQIKDKDKTKEKKSDDSREKKNKKTDKKN